MFFLFYLNVSFVFLLLVIMCFYYVFVGFLLVSECWLVILVGWNDWDDSYFWVGVVGGRINRVFINIFIGKFCFKLLLLVYCYFYIDEK